MQQLLIVLIFCAVIAYLSVTMMPRRDDVEMFTFSSAKVANAASFCNMNRDPFAQMMMDKVNAMLKSPQTQLETNKIPNTLPCKNVKKDIVANNRSGDWGVAGAVHLEISSISNIQGALVSNLKAGLCRCLASMDPSLGIVNALIYQKKIIAILDVDIKNLIINGTASFDGKMEIFGHEIGGPNLLQFTPHFNINAIATIYIEFYGTLLSATEIQLSCDKISVVPRPGSIKIADGTKPHTDLTKKTTALGTICNNAWKHTCIGSCDATRSACIGTTCGAQCAVTAMRACDGVHDACVGGCSATKCVAEFWRWNDCMHECTRDCENARRGCKSSCTGCTNNCNHTRDQCHSTCAQTQKSCDHVIDQAVYWVDATINNTIIGDVANIVAHVFNSQTFAKPLSEKLTAALRGHNMTIPIAM